MFNQYNFNPNPTKFNKTQQFKLTTPQDTIYEIAYYLETRKDQLDNFIIAKATALIFHPYDNKFVMECFLDNYGQSRWIGSSFDGCAIHYSPITLKGWVILLENNNA